MERMAYKKICRMFDLQILGEMRFVLLALIPIFSIFFFFTFWFYWFLVA